MLKKEKEKFYIIIIFAMLLGLVLVWQGIFFARMAIGNKISEILDKKASIGAYSQREEALPIARENYNSAKEKVDEVNKRFIDGEDSVDVGSFFSQLEDFAIETSVESDKIFIENPEAVKTSAKKPASKEKEGDTPAETDKFLRLTVKGKYENLLNFIYKLEAMPYYIDIKSVNIGAGTAGRQNISEKKDGLENELPGTIIIKVFKKQYADEKK